MKILYLAHRIPYPPNKGEKIRAFYQIQYLAKRHSIYLCTFVDDPNDLHYVFELRKFCAAVEVAHRGASSNLFLAAVALLQQRPLSVSLFYRKTLAKKVAALLEREHFDCAIVSSSSMAQYVYGVLDLPKLIDFIDVDSDKWRLYSQHHAFPLSYIYRLEAQRLVKYEAGVAKSFDRSFLTSEAEQRLFRQTVADYPVSVLSNGVDLEYFSTPPKSGCAKDKQTVVFTGAMDYFPNVDAVQYFCQGIFPLVRAEVLTAKFYIVGRNPTRQVKQLGKLPNVTVTGGVPDVRPYLAQAAVAVAPLRLARGVQNKVLEAMAMGLPVVGTSEVFKSLSATETDGVRISDKPEAFAEHVKSFLRGDVTLRREAGNRARSYVERNHRWDHIGAQLERAINQVVEEKSSNRRSQEVKSAAIA